MRRLFEDPEQSPALREDLLRSRVAGADYPTADKLAQLQAALADKSRPELDEADLFKSLTRRAAAPGWKLAALLLVGGGVAALVWPAAHEPAARRPTVDQPVPPPPAAEATVPHAAAPEPSSPSPAAEPATAPLTAASAPADTAAKSSRREIAQLVRIRALLARDPAAAYQLAQRSEREFPEGLLSEERQALTIVALHRTGAREAAAAKAREFFARFPQSPLRELIEAR